jgi:hypothetical protein
VRCRQQRPDVIAERGEEENGEEGCVLRYVRKKKNPEVNETGLKK